MRPLSLAIFLLCGSFCAAQTAAPDTAKEPKFFKLDFVLKEVEGGKVFSSHNYSMIVSTYPRPAGSVRVGSRVDVGDPTGPVNLETAIDCSEVTEQNDQLNIRLSVDATTALTDNTPRPIIRRNRWSGSALVAFKKPTIVFSSDDSASKHVMQFEVTATALRN